MVMTDVQNIDVILFHVLKWNVLSRDAPFLHYKSHGLIVHVERLIFQYKNQ